MKLVKFKDWLEAYLKEQSELEESFTFITEGIEYDHTTKRIWLTEAHEKDINTSVHFIPSVVTLPNGYNVISLFKRLTQSYKDKTDVNPFIYAIKGKDGWSIDEVSKYRILRRFVLNYKEIQSQYDTVLMVYSSSKLNNDFFYLLSKIIKSEQQITDLFRKVPAQEVQLTQFNGRNLTKTEAKKMEEAFDSMETENNGNFSFHFIPADLQYTIGKTKDYNSETGRIPEHGEYINGKNVLILDDTLTTDSITSEYCEDVFHVFTPANVTIVTLFSAT